LLLNVIKFQILMASTCSNFSDAIPVVRVYSTPSFKPPDEIFGARATLHDVIETMNERTMGVLDEDEKEAARRHRPMLTTKSAYRFENTSDTPFMVTISKKRLYYGQSIEFLLHRPRVGWDNEARLYHS